MSVGARRSCNKQQQLTTTWPIAMDVIKAITDCNRQSMPSLWGNKALTKQASQTWQGRPWQSASKPQGGLANERDKIVVRALWVSQQYSSCDNNYCHRSINCRNASTTDARRRHYTGETSGRSGKFMLKISRNEHGINNKTAKKNLQAEQKKQHKTKPLWHICHASHATITGQAANQVAWQSQWHCP